MIIKKDCSCNRDRTKILTTFKVTENLTYLICVNCGGKVAEWVKKIYPPIKDFSPFNVEDMI